MLIRLLEGHKAREEARYRRVAWQTAHLMNVEGKRMRGRVTADALLGLKKIAIDGTQPEPDASEEPAPDAGLAYVALLNAALKGKDVRK